MYRAQRVPEKTGKFFSWFIELNYSELETAVKTIGMSLLGGVFAELLSRKSRADFYFGSVIIQSSRFCKAKTSFNESCEIVGAFNYVRFSFLLSFLRNLEEKDFGFFVIGFNFIILNFHIMDNIM